MHDEFKAFARIIREGDLSTASEMLEHSRKVMQIVEQAKQSAGLVFGADRRGA
ncbi:hypothetical protein D3C72_2528610 [compost metagenome]